MVNDKEISHSNEDEQLSPAQKVTKALAPLATSHPGLRRDSIIMEVLPDGTKKQVEISTFPDLYEPVLEAFRKVCVELIEDVGASQTEQKIVYDLYNPDHFGPLRGNVLKLVAEYKQEYGETAFTTLYKIILFINEVISKSNPQLNKAFTPAGQSPSDKSKFDLVPMGILGSFQAVINNAFLKIKHGLLK